MAGGATIVVIVSAVLAGYALSRFSFPGRRPLMYGVLMTRIIPPTATIIPLFDPKAGYDPDVDFAPLAQLVTYEFACAVAKNVPAKDLRELIAWLKANPDKGAYGTPAAGSSLDFLGVKLAADTKLDLRAVHYRGSMPAVIACSTPSS